MAHLITLFWRDIPAQVIAESGRGRNRQQAKIELARRFAIAIDAAAMKDGADSTDDYQLNGAVQSLFHVGMTLMLRRLSWLPILKPIIQLSVYGNLSSQVALIVPNPILLLSKRF